MRFNSQTAKLRNAPLRTLLFAPGDHPRRLARVGEFGADGVVLDLEDAVADANKTTARSSIRSTLERLQGQVITIVRTNALGTGRLADDLAAVVCPALDAVMIPKVDDPGTLHEVDRLLRELERALGLPEGRVEVLALIETALGVARCEEIALAAPARVATFGFGSGDFSVEMGIDLTRGADELQHPRARLAVATRAAGLAPPVDGPWLLELDDHEGLRADCLRSRGIGFQGRMVIFPGHVAVAGAAYSELDPQELARLRGVVEAFEEALAGGSASIRVDGRFVDTPLYLMAKRRLLVHGDHDHEVQQ